jgi:hypothetical protein
MKAVDFTQCDASDLAETIGQLHALQSAAHRLMLAAIAAFDEQEGWQEDGATSVVPWLVASLGVSHRTAAEWAGAASKLEELPAIADAYGEGCLSWDHVRPLLRFATPETDADLAESAQGWSAAHTAAVARRARPVPEDDQRDAHAKRSLRWWWGDDRMLHFRGRLPDADGATVVEALRAIADREPPEPETGMFEPYEARCADALVRLAAGALGSGESGDRATVIVHADAALLAGEGGVAEVEGGPSVTAETARRLACDGRLRLMADDDRGRTVGVGRVTRSVPPWLLRVVRHRDGGCRFTGCGRTAWTDAHHIVYWSQGGPTDASNLVLLCRHHHKLVHEGGWQVEGHPDEELWFVRPDGRTLATGPPPLRDDVGERVFGAA